METYREFVERHPELPLFYQQGWLDSVAGKDRWKVATVRDNSDKIVGVWPFQPIRKWKIIAAIQTPPLSFQLGPWITYPRGMKISSRYDWEWKILGHLADQLPTSLVTVQLKSPYRLKNWLPLERRGWRQTSRYSYVHPRNWDTDRRWRAMAGRQRTAVRKAEQHLSIDTSPELTEVYRLLQLSFDYRKENLPLPYTTLVRVDEYLSTSKQGTAYTVVDNAGIAHAAGYLAWDQRSMYNLIQGSDPEKRASGAAAMGLWWASAKAAKQDLAFDFEGSHIPGVEKFYRGFGGELWEYYQLSKGVLRIS